MRKIINSISTMWMLYGIPLAFLSLYPRAVSYFGEFESTIIGLVSSQTIIIPNALGILFDILIVYSLIIVCKHILSLDGTGVPRHIAIYDAVSKLIRYHTNNTNIVLNSQDKNNLRIYGIKIFFIPLITSFFIGAIDHVYWVFNKLLSIIGEMNDYSFFFLIVFVFAVATCIDLLIFLIGYLFESNKLESTIISTDPYILGWVACLISYPPFNIVLNRLSGGLKNLEPDYFVFNSQATVLFATAALILHLIFVTASINLGFKASNLTYRGLVDYGVYQWVRHPAYASKMCMWILLSLPFALYDIWYIVPIILIGGVYYLRAITEERHLLYADEEAYSSYKKRVPYRFIPFVW